MTEPQSKRLRTRTGASSFGAGISARRSFTRSPRRIVLAALASTLLVVVLPDCAEPRDQGAPILRLRPATAVATASDQTQPVARTPRLMAKAEELFKQQCAACHGETGDGDGDAAYLLFPKPRNFRAAYFRLTSTQNRVPTDADLYRTITRGIPASSMVSWAHLAEDVRWGLSYHVRDLWKEGLRDSFREEELEDDEAAELIATLTTPGEAIAVPSERADTPESRAAGRALYVERCLSCHGQEGRGDGTEKQVTLEGYPISPADYTQGLFKGGSEPAQLYYRIAKGMAGTPMPESELPGEQIWNLVHYIRSLAKPGAEELALQGRTRIVARRVTAALSDDAANPVWSRATAQYIAVRPLWWRKQRIAGVTVRAVHNSKEVGLLISWKDPSADVDALKTTQFGDGVAVQFSPDDYPPFFGMGDAGKPVNIWHWKAAWEQDALARRDVEHAYPAMLVDYYPDSKVIRPTPSDGERVAPSKTLSARFQTGQGAGNAQAALSHPAPIEDLNSHSFGTLAAQPRVSQDVSGKGVWNKGVWRVVLRRPLTTKDRDDVDFSAGGQDARPTRIRIAFAVWDGAAGDRDGQKAVSIWHDLELRQGSAGVSPAGGKP